MNLLCLDYGQARLGLALSVGSLAEPLGILPTKPKARLYQALNRLIEKHQIQALVIGLSEGKLGEETKNFAQQLRAQINLPLIFQDETLTTQLARQKLIEARAKKKKRRAPPDAYAAALILQEYLDQH